MPDIGLALSGGGAAGLGHIPILEAFDELGVRPAMMAGTSMGALIGAAYAAGMSASAIRAHIIEMAENPLASVRNFLKQSNFSSFKSLTSLDAHAAVATALPKNLPRRIDDLVIPFTIVATDFYGRSTHYFNKGELAHALAASIAIPGVFEPVRLGTRVFVDGGVTNNCPIDAVASADILVAVDVVSGPPSNISNQPSQKTIVLESMRTMMRARLESQLKTLRNVILLEPETRQFGPLEFHKVKDILAVGAPMRELTKRQIARAVEQHDGQRIEHAPGK